MPIDNEFIYCYGNSRFLKEILKLSNKNEYDDGFIIQIRVFIQKLEIILLIMKIEFHYLKSYMSEGHLYYNIWLIPPNNTNKTQIDGHSRKTEFKHLYKHNKKMYLGNFGHIL